MSFNPCLLCGACCAFYRASFYWREADDVTPGGVPVKLTDDLTQTYRVMKGTDSATPHCIALQGEIGHSVFCSIYAHRSTPCREFTPSYADGRHNPRCDKARGAHGLPPLRPEDWQRPPDDLRPAA